MTPPADREALVGAIVHVAERSLFAFAEPGDAADLPGSLDGSWYDATVAFAGPFSGRVSLVMPATLANDLCSAFAGAADGEAAPAEAVRDLAGEFANMVCGSWLSGVAASACFALSHPEVTPVAGPPAADAVVRINDLPVGVVVRYGAPA